MVTIKPVISEVTVKGNTRDTPAAKGMFGAMNEAVEPMTIATRNTGAVNNENSGRRAR